jgi:hypothetical protein
MPSSRTKPALGVQAIEMLLRTIEARLVHDRFRLWKMHRAIVALDNHLRLNHFASLGFYLGSLIRIELYLFFAFNPKV